MSAIKPIPGPYHTVTERDEAGNVERVSVCARDLHGEFQIATMNLGYQPSAAEATAVLLASSWALVQALRDLRDEVARDCEQSDASVERYADILHRVDVVMRKAGVA